MEYLWIIFLFNAVFGIGGILGGIHHIIYMRNEWEPKDTFAFTVFTFVFCLNVIGIYITIP